MREHQDGADSLAWIAKQPWCNGKIATTGPSAMGITQNLMAGAAPKQLTAQYVEVAAASLYQHASYVGGALRQSQALSWVTENHFDPKSLLLAAAHPAYDSYWESFDSTRKFSVMNVPAVHVGGWFDTFSQGTSDAHAPGNQWRQADDWPVPATDTPYYFGLDSRLDPSKPSQLAPAFRQYTFDPANPCPTIGGGNLTIPRGPRNQNPIETRSDVYPDGKSYLLADGILRLRYRNSLPKPQPLVPDEIVLANIDCWSTSIVFNRGHRIRVTVTSSNYPRFDVNPGTGRPWSDDGKKVPQTNRVYCDAHHPSAMVLPLVPADRPKRLLGSTP